MRSLHLAIAFACLSTSLIAADEQPTFVKPLFTTSATFQNEAPYQTWKGEHLITDQATLEKAQKSFGIKDVPKVDFTTQFAFLSSWNHPNRGFLNGKLTTEGDLQVLIATTRRGGPGFGYVLSVLDRKGIKTVNGKPLPARGNAKDAIKIKATGKLTGGIVAIGGETTGVTITADGVTMEVQIPEKLRTDADKLYGKRVMLTGTLTQVERVETGRALIIRAQSITAAPAE